MMGRPAACVTCALLLATVAVRDDEATAGTMKGWNVRVKLFETHLEVPAASGGGLWLGEATVASVFHVGETVVALCQYEYAKVGDAQSFAPFVVELGTTTSGGFYEAHTIATYDKYAAPHGVVSGLWVPVKPGDYNVRCHVGTIDDDVSDNQVDRSVKIIPKAADGTEGGFPAPAPVFAAPAAQQKFVLGPTLHVPVKATIPGVPFGGKGNVAEYAKATPYAERWHVDIVRAGTGQYAAWEAVAGQFEGDVDSLEFGGTVAKTLTARWFAEHGGAGTYRARAYLTQTVQSGTRKGPTTTVEFEIVPPVKSLSGASQPMAPVAAASPPLVGSPRSRTGTPGWRDAPAAVAPPARGGVAKIPGVVPSQRPDLAIDHAVSVGGQAGDLAYNGTWPIIVNSHQATAASSGTCTFALQHTVRNRGSAPSGPFTSAVKSSPGAGGKVSQWASLGAGESATREVLLDLVPGTNDLTLTLDPHFAVSESDETNNTSTLKVLVKGSCTTMTLPTTPGPASGAARVPAPPASGGRTRAPVPPGAAPTR